MEKDLLCEEDKRREGSASATGAVSLSKHFSFCPPFCLLLPFSTNYGWILGCGKDCPFLLLMSSSSLVVWWLAKSLLNPRGSL